VKLRRVYREVAEKSAVVKFRHEYKII